jgi:pimeloyl-ACP methyl ester carboxylesterase
VKRCTISRREPIRMTIRNAFDHTTGQLVGCGDARIYVEEIGHSELRVLLMLHGGFGNIEDFNKIAPALSNRFRLIGIDSRGHGKSSLGTTKLSYKLLTDDLAQVMDALQLQEFSILGFSDGGIVAYRYTARQDPRLKKIVTVGASWELSEAEPAWKRLSGMTAEIWKERFPQSYESYMRLNPEQDFDRLAKAIVAMWTDLSPEGRPGALMEQIKNQMLIVRGDNDPLTTIESMAKLRGITKSANILNIPFAGHVAFDDAPNVFLNTTGRFLGVSLEASLN